MGKMEKKLPEGWEVKTLESVCNIEYGTRVVKKRNGGSIYPVYGGGGATFFMDDYNRENCVVVSRFAMSEKCTRFVSDKFFLNDSGLTVTTKDKEIICQEYVNHLLLGLNDYIYSLGRGTAQRNLNVNAFREIKLFYPKSLEVQKEIVKNLDESFEKIDEAINQTEENLQNAKELFESYLQSVFENGEKQVKNGEWEEKKFGDIFILKSGDGLTAKNMISGVYSVYGGNGLVGKHNDFNNENCVIIGRVGAQCGNVRYINSKFWLTDNAFKIVKGLESFDLSFVVYMLNFCNLRKYARQTAQPVISNSSLKGIDLIFPKSKKTQKAIVKKLEKLQAETEKLEKLYTKKLTDLEDLKKSILQETFNIG